MAVYFFFSSRRRHTRSLCDWSSDVCSSDLSAAKRAGIGADLSTILKRLATGPGQPMPARFAALVAVEAARGLDYAHRQRDPNGNLLHLRSEERRVGKRCRSGWSPKY